MQENFKKVVDQIVGHYCWGFAYDPLLNLSFQIGYPKLSIREPRQTSSKNPDIIWLYSVRQVEPSGNWEFYTRVAYWKITQDDISTTRSSSKKQILTALATLSGQILKNCQVEATGKTQFEFDLGGILEIKRCNNSSVKILWDIYMPDDSVYSVLSDGSFEFETSKSPLKLKENQVLFNSRHPSVVLFKNTSND